MLANTEIERTEGLQTLFIEHEDLVVDNFVSSLANYHSQVIGSELNLEKFIIKSATQLVGHATQVCYAQISSSKNDNPKTN
ncbi:MAG: hypothetical protein H6696_05390 [Deferribacteres bacterium]|nr:hypothetical protein [candidate division KSB1 bacterium]MCB9501351.1 hypothetical protein [Deferribacteres bacterium]